MAILNPMSIGIIGAGAVGGYYGARLAEAGHDVTFLMRRDYNTVKSNGLTIKSPEGDLHIPKPQIVTDSKDISPVDWVICALKATTINDVSELIAPCLHENTNILVLMNGLGLEEFFASLFRGQHIFGGLAFTCINRGEPGIINHLDYGPITIGHFGNDHELVRHATNLWDTAKVEIIAAPSLLQARWEKLCWNIPFNGIGVCSGGISTDIIINDPQLYLSAQNLMKEVINIANADLTFNNSNQQINESKMIKSMFDHTVNIGEYRSSTVIDFLEQRTMEVDAIFNEPLRRAKKLNIKTPYLSLITSLIKNLNKKRLTYK